MSIARLQHKHRVESQVVVEVDFLSSLPRLFASVAGNLAALFGAFRGPFEQAGYAPCGYSFNRGGGFAEQCIANAGVVEAVVTEDRLDGAGDHCAVGIDVKRAPIGGRLFAPGWIFDAGDLGDWQISPYGLGGANGLQVFTPLK